MSGQVLDSQFRSAYLLFFTNGVANDVIAMDCSPVTDQDRRHENQQSAGRKAQMPEPPAHA